MAWKLYPRVVDPIQPVQYNISMIILKEILPITSRAKRLRSLSALSSTVRNIWNTDHCVIIPFYTSAVCHLLEQFLPQRNKFINREIPCKGSFNNTGVAFPSLPISESDVCLSNKPPQQHSTYITWETNFLWSDSIIIPDGTSLGQRLILAVNSFAIWVEF